MVSLSSFKSLSSLSVSLEIPFTKDEIKAVVFGLGGFGLQALMDFQFSSFNNFGIYWRMVC